MGGFFQNKDIIVDLWGTILVPNVEELWVTPPLRWQKYLVVLEPFEISARALRKSLDERILRQFYRSLR